MTRQRDEREALIALVIIYVAAVTVAVGVALADTFLR